MTVPRLCILSDRDVPFLAARSCSALAFATQFPPSSSTTTYQRSRQCNGQYVESDACLSYVVTFVTPRPKPTRTAPWLPPSRPLGRPAADSWPLQARGGCKRAGRERRDVYRSHLAQTHRACGSISGHQVRTRKRRQWSWPRCRARLLS